MPTIRPRGDKFQAIVRIKKNGSIVFQESRMFPTEALAKNWGLRLEQAVKADAGIAHTQKCITLGQLMRDYLDKLERHSSVRRTRSAEVSQVAGYFDRLHLNEMTPADFTKFAEKRRDEGAGPATVLHNLATVRSALNAAKAMFNLQVDGTAVLEAISTLQLAGTVSRSESRERRPSQEERLLIADAQKNAILQPRVEMIRGQPKYRPAQAKVLTVGLEGSIHLRCHAYTFNVAKLNQLLNIEDSGFELIEGGEEPAEAEQARG